MTHQRPLWIATMALAGSIVLFACGSNPPTPGNSSAPTSPQPTPTAPSTSALPPRPAALHLDEVDPCALLTAAQVNQLGTATGRSSANDDGPGSRACIWSNFPKRPDNDWSANTILEHGADYYLASTTASEIVQVAGFPAVQTSSDFQDPNKQCVLLIDVAPGQTLQATYQNSHGDRPGISHQVACQQATKAAELMVANLRNLVH
ncbi:MAG: hypothetical protein QOE32_3031 [Pseudonocardiales bacterium]|nr:hypothetical protein [Pseudonocardiales bacterium]